MSGEYHVLNVQTGAVVAKLGYIGDDDGPGQYDEAQRLAKAVNDMHGGTIYAVLQVEDIVPLEPPGGLQ